MPEISRFRPNLRRPHRRVLVSSLAFAVVGTLVLGACQGEQQPAASPTSSPPTSSTTPTPTPTDTQVTGEADGLDDLFADDDGDGIPNRVQQSLGEDTARDNCGSKVCKSESESLNAALAKIVRGTSTMIILDSSGSMAGKTKDGQTRMAAAKKAVRDYVSSSPASTERLGMMVYGQDGSNQRKDRPESCRKVETLQEIGKLNKDNVGSTLGEFKPTGWTPLARSLREATDEFDGQRNRLNKIIVVSDGIEECGGDPQAEARKLRRSGFNVSIDVVGMGVSSNAPARKQLNGVANAGGGTFTAVNDAKGLEGYFDELLASWVATAKLGSCVSKHFPDYTSCQAVRWKKAKSQMDAEVQKLRDQGATVQADQLQARSEQTAEYYLTTLVARGLTAAQNFDPESEEVKRIEKQLQQSANGRAALDRARVPCND